MEEKKSVFRGQKPGGELEKDFHDKRRENRRVQRLNSANEAPNGLKNRKIPPQKNEFQDFDGMNGRRQD